MYGNTLLCLHLNINKQISSKIFEYIGARVFRFTFKHNYYQTWNKVGSVGLRIVAMKPNNLYSPLTEKKRKSKTYYECQTVTEKLLCLAKKPPAWSSRIGDLSVRG